MFDQLPRSTVAMRRRIAVATVVATLAIVLQSCCTAPHSLRGGAGHEDPFELSVLPTGDPFPKSEGDAARIAAEALQASMFSRELPEKEPFHVALSQAGHWHVIFRATDGLHAGYIVMIEQAGFRGEHGYVVVQRAP